MILINSLQGLVLARYDLEDESHRKDEPILHSYYITVVQPDKVRLTPKV